jgi:peptide/nickel transport system permease protein
MRNWKVGLRAPSLWLLALIIGAALLAPWLAPQNPYDLAQIDLLDSRLPPGSEHYLLGTDEQGRDLLSAMLYGLRISLAVGAAGTLLAFAFGSALGLFAGYRGGRWDSASMRLADLQLSFPAILVALVLLALLGPGLGKVVIALATAQWAYFARTARAAALVESRKDYIAAARLTGLGEARILWRHLLPNCLPPLLVVLPLQLAAAISLEATLSFLGLGAPATEPSLGLLIANGYQYLLSGKYWISFYPGLVLAVTITAINLVADWLRARLDPRG